MMLSEQHNDLGHDMTYFAMERQRQRQRGAAASSFWLLHVVVVGCVLFC
jgi:hypothetical protein